VPPALAVAVRTGEFAQTDPLRAAPSSRPVRTSGFEDAGRSVPTQSAGVGRVASAGSAFDTPDVTQARGRPVEANTSAAGFDMVLAAAPARRSAMPGNSDTFHSVEILTKPKPEYTDEARRRRIEGEVWLEILFGADGVLRIRRVLRSLGYGLDESAIRAAQHIHFRPARDGSQPRDELATVRVQFQLAE
jgi:TonB family protein